MRDRSRGGDYRSRDRNDERFREDNSRYDNRNYNNRGRSDYGPRSRYSNTRGDYGPVLARELDSSYEEKVHRNYANSVFVGNLTYNCTPEDLKDYFSSVGEVVRADIITSRGHHRGMGTVEYTNTRDVDEAIRQFDGSYFMDRSIFVRQDNPPPESKHERSTNRRTLNNQRREGDQNSYIVRVQNLPYSINWQALKDMFKECGDVSRADVDMDSSGYSKGSGIVVFSDETTMNKAIDMYNNFECEGKTLSVTEVKKDQGEKTERNVRTPETLETPESIDSVNEESIVTATKFTEGYEPNGAPGNFIFCSNLPDSTAKSDLFDLFGTIGSIANAELRYDAVTKSPTGIAVVEYNDPADADICIDRLQKYNYGGCDLDISYAKKI